MTPRYHHDDVANQARFYTIPRRPSRVSEKEITPFHPSELSQPVGCTVVSVDGEKGAESFLTSEAIAVPSAPTQKETFTIRDDEN